MVLALCRSQASTAEQRSNPNMPVGHWPGKTRRDFALKPPIAVEADRTVFVRVDPERSTDQGLLNAYGGVTAALKRAV